MTGMIFGMTLAVTGLYVALGPVAGGITAIVSGLAVLAVAFSDAEKTDGISRTKCWQSPEFLQLASGSVY